MNANKKPIGTNLTPDDAPELTPKLAQRAQIAVNGKIIREATGTVTKRGRPPVGDVPKQQVTLRLAPRVVRYFKETGDGWQTRLNETLEEYVTAAVIKDARRQSVSLAEVAREANARAKTNKSGKKIGLSANIGLRDAVTGKLSKTKKSLHMKRTGSSKR
jgi:uncharacterized protein (DUF4415 family)